ncbi:MULTISPECIES: hypothetical protein [unclassified Rhodococcus (in: high G+C Gram-positive bacteria)]|uniref:hypothetical protein n=1 Tax=unclassified Rhodococcus (in: high G+C Gram-positive bacteria) TaxID=192944 RepID=UPI001639FFE6|nr:MULTISPECIES: hypothetical protein [unclassified Rhodococcus (in: high G+C Gram-positive bacteria)]MBC2644395.1 hypothetical protein [Rhodococcus sp. 3A]
MTQPALTDALSFVESTIPASQPNDYAVLLGQRLVTGGGGAGGGVPPGGFTPNMDFIDTLAQYVRGGLSPRLLLSNVIGFRNLLIKQGAPKRTIDLFNRQVGETAMWYKHYWQGTAEDA